MAALHVNAPSYRCRSAAGFPVSPVRVGSARPVLGTGGGRSELPGMTSFASSATWLPTAIVRAAVIKSPPAQWVPTGRHSAPDAGAVMDDVATDCERDRRGRHAEPEWSREMFDALRDEDPFDWLGFTDLG